MADPSAQQRARPPLRWFCGVPVLANPLILIDLACACVAMWFVAALLVVAAQAVFGEGPLRGVHIAAACAFAGWVSALLPAMYLCVCLLFFRRGYVALYRFEDAGIFMETTRAGAEARGGVFAARPFPVGECRDTGRGVAREVPWDAIKSVRELPGMRVLHLRGRFSTLARVYCPDEETFRAAGSFARKKVNGRA